MELILDSIRHCPGVLERIAKRFANPRDRAQSPHDYGYLEKVAFSDGTPTFLTPEGAHRTASMVTTVRISALHKRLQRRSKRSKGS